MADINAKDREAVRNNKCPDCGSTLFNKMFSGEEKPVCFKCNTWFEIWGSGNVVRCLEANKHYMQTEDELGNYWEGAPYDLTN